MSTTAEQILDLKRQALALKDAGDTNGAMALLAQARDLEFENASVEDLWEPLQLKQFAVVMKKRGDLDSARQALIKAKQIEKEGLTPSTPQPENTTQEPKAEEPVVTSCDEGAKETTATEIPQESVSSSNNGNADPPEAAAPESSASPIPRPAPSRPRPTASRPVPAKPPPAR